VGHVVCVHHAHNRAAGPSSRTHRIVRRIADRYGSNIADAFLTALSRLDAGIDKVELSSAVASGDVNAIVAAIGPSRLGAIFAGGDSLSKVLQDTAAASGGLGMDVLSEVTGMQASFNAVDPNVVMFARERAARLVVDVTEDVIEAVRIVIAAGAAEGLTTVQQARAIREVVGLPPNWAEAPSRLASELRAGRFTSSRRLSAIDKARIRKRLKEGTITEDFISEIQANYARSLTNRRALNIARTESATSANHGMRTGWRQARDQGVLSEDVKRIVVVTHDEELRETHAAVPFMNQGGVGLDEPFETPWGPLMGPPWDPDPYNCLLPGTPVRGRFVAGVRAHYRGEVITIHTAGGRKLAVTSNHPVLTRDGFVAAQRVRDGHQLLCYSGDAHGATAPGAHEHGAPAAVDDVFHALGKLWGQELRDLSVEDLHGDAAGTDGKVDVVRPDRVLLVDGLAQPLDGGGNSILVLTTPPTISVASEGSGGHGLGAVHATARSGVGGAELPANGFRVRLELLPFQLLGFGAPPELYPGAFESMGNHATVVPGSLADRLDRFAREIGGADAGHVDLLPKVVLPPNGGLHRPGRQPPFDTPLSHGGSTDSKLARDLLERHAGLVELDEVVAVDVSSWHGHVYDLQSVTGFNIASDVFVSNCRCGEGLIFPGGGVL